MSHRSSGHLRDWVFPVVSFQPDPNATQGMAGPIFRGSGFLVAGTSGLAFTAKHVAAELEVGLAAGLFVEEGRWRSYAIHEIRDHPNEDVSVLMLEENEWESPFELLPEQHHASARYSLWGYPTDVMYECIDDSGVVLPRYELVYSEGHIRRRVSNVDLPAVPGHQLFELSNAAGAGCSGSPVVLDRTGYGRWSVIGVYVGQRHSERENVTVGYATRTADLDLADFRPRDG